MVGWNNDGVQFIDRVKFEGFSICCIGYIGQFFIQMEVVLEGNRCQCLVFILNFNVFFCFYCLVQIVRLVMFLYGMIGMFINNDDFVVFYNVIYVMGKQCVCVQCGGDVMYQYNIVR